MNKIPKLINILLLLLILFSLSLFIISFVMLLTPGSYSLTFFSFLLSTITAVSAFGFYKKQHFSWWFLICYLSIFVTFLLYSFFRLLSRYCLISSLLLILILFFMYNEDILHQFKISVYKKKLSLVSLFGFASITFIYLILRDFT